MDPAMVAAVVAVCALADKTQNCYNKVKLQQNLT